jgi:hypothetical protein
MSKQSNAPFPPTLIFSRVEAFLDAVQVRGLEEVGHATLKRVTPFAEGMGERRISFLLLTARDAARNEILSCSVYLHYGDFVAGDQLLSPREEWERQQARGAAVRQQVLQYVRDLPKVRLIDATYHVHPDVAVRFATFSVGTAPDETTANT